MDKARARVFVLLCFWGFTTMAAAQTQPLSDDQYAAIKSLGQLNGIALHCGFLPETQRMKKSLVLALPKVRQFGEAFDIETNQSFLNFIAQKSVCPSEQTFVEDVDAAIIELDKAFAKNPAESS